MSVTTAIQPSIDRAFLAGEHRNAFNLYRLTGEHTLHTSFETFCEQTARRIVDNDPRVWVEAAIKRRLAELQRSTGMADQMNSGVCRAALEALDAMSGDNARTLRFELRRIPALHVLSGLDLAGIICRLRGINFDAPNFD